LLGRCRYGVTGYLYESIRSSLVAQSVSGSGNCEITADTANQAITIFEFLGMIADPHPFDTDPDPRYRNTCRSGTVVTDLLLSDFNQCCGSGSGSSWLSWIWIQQL